MKIKIKFFLLVICLGITTFAFADQFVINKIQVHGLQRISQSTFLSYLPVKEGDRIDSSRTPSIIRAIYKTGFFTNVDMSRKNGSLIITVKERPVIGSLNISGNKKISSKQMEDVLKAAGLVEGEVFDSSALKLFEQSLTQQYYDLGAYNVNIQTSVTPQSRNRVAVNINITEGPVAKIKLIRIMGNHAFTEKELLKNFTLRKSSILTIFSSNDQYSKEKLDADLEKLRSFYFDHGYINFRVDSAQVSITPDKKSIYITISVYEGPVFRIKGFSISGNLIGQKENIYKLVKLQPGDVFSRKTLLDAQTNITMYLGVYGYGMPDVKVLPDVNEETKLVFVRFIVTPGKKIYIRRINISGNTKTKDEVIRREIRQQEGALYSSVLQELSKQRLANLGYISDVNSKVEPVPGCCDQVDLDYSLKEASSASANFQVGYSTSDGLLYGINVTEQNLFGSGKAVSIGFDNSEDSKNYSISYTNPYFTDSHISMQTRAYAQFNNPGAINLSAYSANIFGGTMTFGFPFSEYNTMNLGYGFEHIEIGTTSWTSQQVFHFLDVYGNTYNDIKLLAGWTYSNLDKAIFPTKGFAQNLNLNLGIPAGNEAVDYYTAEYKAYLYYPIYQKIIFRARGELGYGNGYGSTHVLPFFKNFYAGGIDTVRGFETGSLGPLDNFGNPLGGSVSTVASASIIIPNPLGDTLRTSVFTDVGNVYENQFVLKDLRASVGVQGEWQSPLGPLVFSLATPYVKKPHDRTEVFQFNIGTSL